MSTYEMFFKINVGFIIRVKYRTQVLVVVVLKVKQS